MRAVALIVVLVACSGGTAPPASTAPPATPPATPQPAGEETFSGTITEIDFGCAADARCALVVDNSKRVAFGHDSRGQAPAAWGNSDEVFALMEAPQQGVGRRVEVFAAKAGDAYTLRGKETYYIKVLP